MGQYHQAGGAKIEERIIKFAVVYEKATNDFSAYVPDLPGCVATGATREEVKKNIREAIDFHVEGFKLENLAIPEPSALSETVEIVACATE